MKPGRKPLRKEIDLTARLDLAKWLFLETNINFTQAKEVGEVER